MTCAGTSLANLDTVADPLPRRHGSAWRSRATACPVAATVEGPSALAPIHRRCCNGHPSALASPSEGDAKELPFSGDTS
jgi:hypothetical protein